MSYKSRCSSTTSELPSCEIHPLFYGGTPWKQDELSEGVRDCFEYLISKLNATEEQLLETEHNVKYGIIGPDDYVDLVPSLRAERNALNDFVDEFGGVFGFSYIEDKYSVDYPDDEGYLMSYSITRYIAK